MDRSHTYLLLSFHAGDHAVLEASLYFFNPAGRHELVSTRNLARHLGFDIGVLIGADEGGNILLDQARVRADLPQTQKKHQNLVVVPGGRGRNIDK